MASASGTTSMKEGEKAKSALNERSGQNVNKKRARNICKAKSDNDSAVKIKSKNKIPPNDAIASCSNGEGNVEGPNVDEELLKYLPEYSTFVREDKFILQLYRRAIDNVTDAYKLKESDISRAIEDMQINLGRADTPRFQDFAGVDFNNPAYCCGYLMHYAACHTGLIKSALWRFFINEYSKMHVASLLSKAHLNVVSLGGGPGCDIVGFCSALQDTNRATTSLDLKIIQAESFWPRVFQAVVVAARSSDFGSVSKFFGTTRIKSQLMISDLTRTYTDKAFKEAISNADVVLMVKTMSMLPAEDRTFVLPNVVRSMKTDGILIFIDSPFQSELFKRVRRSLKRVFSRTDWKYMFKFKPSKYSCTCVCESTSHIHVFEKQNAV